MSNRRGTARLVGRTDELRQLLSAFEEARNGPTAAVFIGGESGVGKTRLVTELVDSLRHTDALVCAGNAIDISEEPSFWPVLDGIRKLLHRERRPNVREVLAPFQAGLDQLLPVSSQVPAAGASWPGEPAADGSLLPTLELLGGALAALGSQGPVVLVVEDLHWADRSTRDLLVYLLTNTSPDPLLIIATYRSDAISSGHPLRRLLPELRRHHQVHFLDLEPLSRQAIAEMIESILGDSPNDSVLDLVWQRCGGNAFIAEETIRAIEDGHGSAVPQTLTDLVLARVDSLAEPVRSVLRAVAVGESPVGHRLLASVVELPEHQLLAALRSAVDEGILMVDPTREGYRFRHTLFKDVLYADLLPGERIHLHATYGRVLAEEGNRKDSRTATRLAYHWDQAQDWPRAFGATVAAAQQAERVYGFAEADRSYARALELDELVDPSARDAGVPPRALLLERAAEVAHLAGEHERAISVLQCRLREDHAVDRETGILLRERLGQYLTAGGQGRQALRAFEEARSRLQADDPPALRVQVLDSYARALLLSGRYQAAQREAEAALRAAEQLESPSRQSGPLGTLGFALAYLGDPDAGLAALEQGRRLAENGGQPEDLGQAYVRLAELLAGPLNRLDEGAQVAEAGANVTRELGLERTYGATLWAIAANTRFRAGRWEDADTYINHALACRPAGTAAIEILLARVKMLLGRDQLDEAETDLATIDVLTAEAVGPRFRIPALTLRAGLELWRGRPERARAAVLLGLEAAENQAEIDVWLMAPLIWHGMRAEGDRTDQARLLGAASPAATDGAVASTLLARVQRLAEEAGQHAPEVADMVKGYLLLCQAEATRAAGTSDPDAWAHAADAWAQLAHPYPTAYARWHQAEALFANHARAAGAAAALTEAHGLALRLGALPLLRLIDDLAARARVDVAARPGPQAAAPEAAARSETIPAPLDALTRRELAVLLELAEGRTNREIADKLYISEKTVSVHVSRVLAKLSVRSRVQASAIVHRLNPPLARQS